MFPYSRCARPMFQESGHTIKGDFRCTHGETKEPTMRRPNDESKCSLSRRLADILSVSPSRFFSFLGLFLIRYVHTITDINV